MKKKILICSLLTSSMLLLMPSIPAIQQKTFEKRVFNDLIEKFENKGVTEIEVFEQIKYPFLFFIVWMIFFLRVSRALSLYDISTEWDYEGGWHDPDLEIKYPLVFIRFLMLIITAAIWMDSWERISNILDLNWCFYL